MKEMWRPSKDRIEKSQMYQLMKICSSKYGFENNYQSFHEFSVEEKGEFWKELIDFYDLKINGDLNVICEDMRFEKYGWFPQAQLNFAENLLLKGKDESVALNFVHESGLKKEYSYKDLKDLVSSFQNSLQEFFKEGDILAAYMPNIPETIISMLGATSLGGVFTSTSSDFGIEGVLDRFSQSRPKVLVAAAGYEYGGKYFDQTEKIQKISDSLDCLEKIIIVDFLNKGGDFSNIKNSILWDDFLSERSSEIKFVQRKFSDPIYIMYSSGTTGKPKCIVHTTGGTLLQHVKELGLHTDLTSQKNIFYFTTCGWMMWNWLVSSLFFGSKITLYEGSPGFPSLKDFFLKIDSEKINIFGTSPKFLKVLEDSGYNLDSELKSLELVLSTGAPLLPEQYDFIYEKIKGDIQVASISGGTDILGCFMLGNPLVPVVKGEIQSIGLGMNVKAFSDSGESLIDKEGELVCISSFPSRPLCFLNDQDSKKMKSAYFEKFENTWHHGDFISISKNGGVIVYGRSDATLNPGGVRIGTSEIYRQTEGLSFLEDSICVGKQNDGDVDVYLFVKLKENEHLSDERVLQIKKLIKDKTTPRHVPKKICEVSGIPYTRSGKKMELAVTRLINGRELNNIQAVSNPEVLEEYKKF